MAIARRSARQIGSGWLLRYELEYRGETDRLIAADSVHVDYEATLSNSRMGPHHSPRSGRVEWNLSEQPAILVISQARDLREKCHEALRLAISLQGEGPVSFPNPQDWKAPAVFKLKPGSRLLVSLSIEHEHAVYGRYEPLLGRRTIQLSLGDLKVRDAWDSNQTLEHAESCSLLSPPEPRDLDEFNPTRSVLHLYPDEPGHLFYRFPEVPVRHGATLYVSFWYRQAARRPGICRVRVSEYQDTAQAWYRLEGGFEQDLAAKSDWTYFERRLVTRPDTTTLAIDFRFPGETSGEAWIDSVSIIPAQAAPRP